MKTPVFNLVISYDSEKDTMDAEVLENMEGDFEKILFLHCLSLLGEHVYTKIENPEQKHQFENAKVLFETVINERNK